MTTATRPVAQPVAQPTGKPAGKPFEEQIGKSSAGPVDKSALEPDSQPISGRSPGGPAGQPIRTAPKSPGGPSARHGTDIGTAVTATDRDASDASTTTAPIDGAATRGARPRGWLVLAPPGVTLGLLAIGALGTGFVGRFRSAESPRARAFTSLLEFDLWSALVGASIALYAAVAWAMTYAIRERWRHPADRPRPTALAILLTGTAILAVAVFTILRFFTRSGSTPVPLDGVRWRMPLLLGLGMLAALPGAVGLWDIQAKLLRLSARIPKEPGTPPPPDALRELDRAWRDAMRFLTGGSLIISTAVVDVGALRNALLAYGIPEQRFPASSVLLYGAFFSVMFALVFLPVVLLWRSVAARLLAAAVGIPEPDGLNDEWLARRGRLMTFLHLDLSLMKVLKPALGILAPLVTGALSLFLPGSGR
ncbi:PT domain-containing protein [Streptomyces sp. MST-110588]|uniref:PT domain-containing protein n=1 Tax=Streptomyces sp. MST-110588 TaxID=2833628 RepID=UPI001F5CF582|nr:PT domain-containing protein [Streptomyces sp. MST-110588]UNO43119.1 hypothetical protein KGS77_31010 [Streptomyces sp. MST-110588]